ncbi:hypothetical protein K437DRAFT_254489 [Tilletiaria anomala UBC 951]|uniref:Chloride channel protein n=1 Tax=Tilletiaria anomala (strain ATCC 24038 / CBS 436.72 / UBC 951) TaxID=1037660 RepID=A0A066WNV6_TILAU|nr:uncharacterized protein K437DRAFT_254489 [Tilletiaria anomala UBC 951]KDN52290.1 hypothetical protein K437DRAFT_254489 [Tilletiaria anomala UBC 951]
MPDPNGAESSAAGQRRASTSVTPPLTPGRRGSAARSVEGLPAPAEQDEDALDEIKRYESFSTVDWLVDGSRERARLARASAKRLQTAGVVRRFHSSDGPLASNGSTSAAYTSAAGVQARLANSDTADWGQLGFAPHERPPRWWPMRNFWGRKAWWAWRFVVATAAAAADSGVVVLVGIFIGINMAIISIATEWASDLKQGYCKAGWWLNAKFCCWETMDPGGLGGSMNPLPRPPGKAIAMPDSLNSTSNLTVALAGRAMETALWYHSQFTSRADGQGQTGNLSETCTDWVPWSTWTLPAWFVYVFAAVVLSSTCAWLVQAFAPYAAGSGISEIKCILAGFIINGYLGVWTFVIKSLTLPLAIASGLSVGKEGPAVHVACCIGNIVSSFFRELTRSQAKMRELLTASSAAGVAVAFGSPIGGVLFSLEEMAYNFPATTMWRSFLCALAATVTLSFMNPFRTGKLVLFQVSYDRDWHYFEILFYLLIGVFGGLYGALVIKYNLQVQSFRRNHLASHGISEAAILAMLTASVAYFNKFLRIDMTESLEILFRECEGGGDYDNLCQSSAQWRMVNSLLLATIIRFALVIISYGCKVPAGIFVPSMAIGATFGRMVGILVKALHQAIPNAAFFAACEPDVPCITPGTYAFLGAAAALAGVTRITVAVVVIMFELTGALTYILPTMIVVMVTKGIGDWYGKGGIAEQMIRFNGYPFLDKDEHAFGIPVQDVMKQNPVTVYATGMTLEELERRLSEDSYKGFPLVQGPSDGTLLGYVGKTELRYALGNAKRSRNLGPRTQIVFMRSPETAARRNVKILITPLLPSFGGDGPVTPRTPGQSRLDEECLMSHARAGEGDEESEGSDLDDADGGVNGEGEDDELDLGGWVDQTPLSVPPAMALEVVMDLFKKMGPRVILVSKYGNLAGLVTVKDVLKFVAAQEKAEAMALKIQAQQGEDELPYARMNGAADPEDEGELELLLSYVLDWSGSVGRSIFERVSPFLARFAPRNRPRPPTARYSRPSAREGHVVFDEGGMSPNHSPEGPTNHTSSVWKTDEVEQFVLGEV